MQIASGSTIYDDLGVTPVINALGYRTVLGGSSFSPGVRAAMEAANRYFVDMAELLDKSGQIVADLIGAEAAYITPGAAAAITLGTAACIAGDDGANIDRLPDATGLKNEVVIQRGHRYKYDRCPTLVGGRLIEVGDASGTTAAQLEAALGTSTAAILFPAHLDGQPGTLPLDEVLAIGKRHGVPVLVDAAYQVYPLDHMKSYTKRGVDLVCFASKYFNGPNSAGFLCGRKDLVTSASLQGFIGFETTSNRPFGRPLKLDRQEIVALVVALREWMTMDHGARIRGYEQKLQSIAAHLEGLPGLTYATKPAHGPEVVQLHITVDPAVVERSASKVSAALRAGNPRIWLDVDGDTLIVAVSNVHDGDEQIVARRLRELLAK